MRGLGKALARVRGRRRRGRLGDAALPAAAERVQRERSGARTLALKARMRCGGPLRGRGRAHARVQDHERDRRARRRRDNKMHTAHGDARLGRAAGAASERG